MRETVEQKADRYLAEGRVRVVSLDPVVVRVRGSVDEPYEVRFVGDVGTCSCPAQVRCAHLVAASKIVDGGERFVFSDSALDEVLEGGVVARE